MQQIATKIQPYIGKYSGTLVSYDLPRGWSFQFSYFQALLTVILLFLLVLTLGQLRHRFIGWQLSGVLPGVSFGFVLALILEGIFIIGGRTIFTELIGWKNAPKPISTALDAGRGRLVSVLGVTDEVPSSNAEDVPTVGGMMSLYSKMSSEDQESLQSIVCH